MITINHIHRAGLSGGAACGFQPTVSSVRWSKYPLRRPLRLSASGVVVTCPECLDMDRQPSREEILANIATAAASYRNGRH